MQEPRFGVTDWSSVERVKKTAQAGQALWQMQEFGKYVYVRLSTPLAMSPTIGAKKAMFCMAWKLSLIDQRRRWGKALHR
jgi:hypothetical protein